MTKEEFFKRKIFYEEKIPVLRRLYSNQATQINQWYKSSDFHKVRDLKSFLKKKLETTQDIEEENFEITPDLLYRFYEWWKDTDRVCHYCGLPETELHGLHHQEGHINKRWPRRGQSLEVDRKQSYLPYTDLHNLALACYWCNNAKTDTFTYAEFREVGRVINKIWETRLGQHFAIPEN